MALDASLSNTGIAIVDKHKQIIKLHTISTKPTASLGSRLIEISTTIEELIKQYNIELILLEGQYMGGSLQCGFVLGNIYRIAEEQRLAVKTYQPTTIKKVVTGSGKAKKSDMKKYIEEIFNLKARSNEHVRDALGLVHTYFVKEGVMYGR